MLTTRATQALTPRVQVQTAYIGKISATHRQGPRAQQLRRVIIPLKLSEKVFKTPSIGARKLSSLGLMGSAPNGFGDQLDQSFTVI